MTPSHPTQMDQQSGISSGWRSKLRDEALTVGTFESLPDYIYLRFLGRDEWLSFVSDIHCRTFCLLVAEAA